MTCAQLIAILQTHPPDRQVMKCFNGSQVSSMIMANTCVVAKNPTGGWLAIFTDSHRDRYEVVLL